MSSVTRFLRQIPAENQFVTAGDLVGLGIAAYEFVNTTANYTGNYPPGAMVLGSNDGNTLINFQIQNATNNIPNSARIIRDMGKTVYAGVAPTVADAQNNTNISARGYFRQYQLLIFNTGTTGTPNTTFGVGGSQAGGYTPYLTFYLPSIVAGICPVSSYTALPQSIGGQV